MSAEATIQFTVNGKEQSVTTDPKRLHLSVVAAAGG